jgi:hypothetical protein
MNEPIHIISLGAGVQSSTMALMAASGEITTMPTAAIFADTGAEPRKVYEWLDWLETQLPFPVHRVGPGDLRETIVAAMTGEGRMDGRPPFYTQSGGMLNRQCTGDFKIDPIRVKAREMIGLTRGQRGPNHIAAVMWIGISTDEAQRMKPSQHHYIEHRWPLIDLGMSRQSCLLWMSSHGYERPPKSACTFCPYHDDAMWRDMKENDPESWADAIAIDELIRPGIPGPKRPDGDGWYLHRSRKPLAEVDLRTAEDAGQLSMFDDECAGICGV